MNTIWKFPLDGFVEQHIEMPIKAQILTVQMQGNGLMLWALVNPSHGVKETRKINIIGTGWEIEDAHRKYIATVQQGALVWHIFERL